MAPEDERRGRKGPTPPRKDDPWAASLFKIRRGQMLTNSLVDRLLIENACLRPDPIR